MTTENSAPAGMSADQEAGSPELQCDIDHIPLFPVRYTLTGEALVNAKDGTACGAPPASLASVDNVTFELARTRGGYVFIYTESGLGVGADTENLWHPFFHYTTPDDDNSAAPRIDTEKQRAGTAHHFYKYHWETGTADGAWNLYTNDQLSEAGVENPQTYPYPFVALGTTKAWVAYSEERWPAHFFKKVQDDAAFRNKMMTEVQISEEPATSARYAPLSELPNLSRSFSDDASSIPSLAFTNSIRHTVIEPSAWTTVANSICAQRFGYVVLVDDPVAMALDLGAMIILQQEVKTRLAQKYMYPLVTGQIVQQLQESETIRTNTWSLLWGESRPHIEDFEAQFERVKSESQAGLDAIHRVEQGVFATWRSLVDQTAPGSIHDRMTAYLDEFDAAPEEDRAEIAGSALYEFARAAQPFALCDNGQIAPYFDGILIGQGTGGASATAMATLIAKFGGALATTLTTAQDRNFFYLLGWSAAVETFSSRLNKRGNSFFLTGQRLVVMQEIQPQTFRTREDAAAAIERIYDAGRFNTASVSGGTRLPAAAIDNVITQTVGPRFPGAQSQTSYTIEAYRPMIAEEVPPSWLTRAKQVSVNGAAPLSGLGVLAAGFSLSGAVSKWNEARNYRQVQDWLFDPSVVVLAAFTEFTMSIYAARQSANALAQSSQMFARFYGSLPSLSGTAIAQSYVGRGAGSFMRGLGAKILGPVLGLYMSGKDFNEGFSLDDNNMRIAGGLGASSVLAFAAAGFVTGPAGWIILTIGALAAVGGAVYGYYRLNNFEIWVRKGIWGGDADTEWWGRSRNTFAIRKFAAEDLANPNATNYAFASAAYEQEMEEFFNAAANLTVTNQTPGDGQLEIICPEINSAHDLTRLELEIYMYQPTEINGGHRRLDLTMSRDYTLRFDGGGRATIVLNPASFPTFAQVDRTRPDLFVVAQFTRSNGAVLNARERFPGSIESQ